MNEVYVVSAVRTAIGTFGGSLRDIPPAELASRVTADAVRRASVAPAEIGHVVFGQVVQTEPRDMYVSRVAAVDAGIPVETPALTVNRLCGSGLQAIVSAAQSIKLGDCDVAVRRRRGGEHEPGAVPGAVIPMGHQNGERPDRRRARQRASRSFPSGPDGRNG